MKKIIVIILSVIFIFLILFGYSFYKKKTRNAVDMFIERNNLINILIAGSNSFGEKHPFYAIVSINPENSRTGITFIPPDFKISIDGRTKNFIKIEDADLNDFNRVSESLQNDLKLNIPFYVVIYSPDVERFVDLIEGVNLYVLDKLNLTGINFGSNYFDGDKIDKYINSVEENSIYRKYDRIQNVLLTLYYDRNNFKKFVNSQFISEILKSVKTNLLTQEILSLSRILYARDSDLRCIVMPGFLSQDGFYSVDDVTYKFYKNNFLKKLVLDDEPEQEKIKILNGTDVPGLAEKLRRRLVNEGFNVAEFGTSPYPPFDKSVLINLKGEIGPVRKVSEFLGVDRIFHSVDSTQLNNVLLIIGKDLAK